MILELVRDALAANPPVSALVGNRIYPRALPPQPVAQLPAITLHRISNRRVRSQDGPSQLARPRVQVDAWAATDREADQVADAVRECLDGYRNTSGGGAIQGAFSDVERDIYDQELKLVGRSADYLVWHEE